MSKIKNEEVAVATTSSTYDLSSYPTKAAQIRYLDSLGLTRSQIVKVLEEKWNKKILYQHVRNVLITPIKKK